MMRFVIYINSTTEGHSSTTGFEDNGGGFDALRKAISGYDGTNRSVVNFPAGFDADYAIAFHKDFGGIWQLNNDPEHTFVTAIGLLPTGTASSTTYSFSFNKSAIGLAADIQFTFVATYINSGNAFRSDETIGKE